MSTGVSATGLIFTGEIESTSHLSFITTDNVTDLFYFSLKKSVEKA